MFYFNSLIIDFVVVLFILLITIFAHFKYSYTYWTRKGVPTLKPSIPFGNSHDLAFQIKSFGEHGASMYNRLKKKTNHFGGFYIFSRPVLLPIDPELIKSIITKDFNSFQDRGLYSDEENDPLSAHLVNLRGAKWKILRAKLTPTFTSGKMKMMFQTLIDCSDELEKVLETPTDNNEPVDIGDILGRLTTDNIGSCAFGLDCNSLKDPDAEFRTYGKLLIQTTMAEAKWNMFAINFPRIMKFFKIPMINTKVSKFFMGAIKHTVNYREKNNIQRKDFLDLFIKLKNNETIDDESAKKNDQALTFNELAAQAFVFYVAGFETSSTAMTFCLLELSLNQEIQDKVRREIFMVLKKHGGEMTYDAIMEMTYMDKVLNEAMRKYPPLPMLNRESNQTYNIPGSSVTIGPKVGVWISVLGIHRDPDIYPDPHKFDPERFSDEEKAKRHPYTYLPFGEGPRICIGLRFGVMQMKVGLAKLLKSYKFRPDSDIKMPLALDTKGIFLAPKDKIWLRTSKITE